MQRLIHQLAAGILTLACFTTSAFCETRTKSNPGQLASTEARARAQNTRQARLKLQKLYDAAWFRRGDLQHSVSLHWPSEYLVNDSDIQRRRTIKSIELRGNTALLVTEFRDSVVGVHPKTHRKVKFEGVDVYRDQWVHKDGKWQLKHARRLSGDHLTDDKSMFDISNFKNGILIVN